MHAATGGSTCCSWLLLLPAAASAVCNHSMHHHKTDQHKKRCVESLVSEHCMLNQQPALLLQAAHVSHSTRPLLDSLSSSSSNSSSIHRLSYSSSSSSSRRSVIAADKRAKANPFVDLQRDVLPDGKPNTPWRRLKLRIQTTNSLQVRGCGCTLCFLFV
jgi:hypothetical protein